jgi:hypothetical protein
VGREMLNRKEMPQQAFSGKLKKKKKKKEKFHASRFPSYLSCRRTPVNVFLLTITHEDEFVEAPS